jgi:hypothetical protein
MDELSMIRELLHEPPADPGVVERGRERLLESSVSRPRPSAGRPQLWAALGLGLTGAAAAAAVTLGTLGLGAGTTPGGGAPALAAPSARTVLLAAAVQAASAPTSGAYWHVRSMARTTLPRRFGHDGHRYRLEQLSITERWTTHSGRTMLGRRDWVRPKSSRDEAAWRQDGAPGRWCKGHTDTAPARPICLRVGPDTFEVTEGRDLTFAQLQRLPSQPGALRRWLMVVARHDLAPSAGRGVVNLNVEQELANLLVDFPVRPAVRAAAFRALAAMPHVTNVGAMRDELGRPGVGIEIRDPQTAVLVSDGSAVGAREGRLSRVLIIDPRTSRILADRMTIGHAAEPTVDTLILAAGWTNERPRRPAFPGSAPGVGDVSRT